MCSVKKGALRNFAKLTVKHLCQSLFLNNSIKKETLAQCFPVNFAKFLRIPFLQNISGRLLLEPETQHNRLSSQEWRNCQNCEEMPTRLECVCWHKIPEVKAFNLKG